MSKLLLITLVIFLFTVHASTAQIEKGNKLLGASMYVSFRDTEGYNRAIIKYSNDESEGYTLAIYPYMGFFVKDGVAIGGELELSTQSYQNSSSDSSDKKYTSLNHESRIGASFFVKRMRNLKGKLGWYLQPELGYRFEWKDDQTKVTEIDMNDVQRDTNYKREGYDHLVFLNATAGLYYFLSDVWSVEAEFLSISLQYGHDRLHNEANTTYSDGRAGNAEESTTRQDSGFRLSSNLANHFSLSKVFTVNYYF